MYGIDVWTPLSPAIQSALQESAILFSISDYTTQQAVAAQELDSKRVDNFPCTFATTRYIPGPKPPDLLERYDLHPEQPILLTISRLAASEQYKGHEQVLQALPSVAKTFPDVRYLIGGTGDYADALKQRSRELGVADHVIFAGFIPNDELAAHYQLCDAFVMPSRGEGFGIVFLEAMGCGKPVIGGNQDGSVDALDGGRLGVLVDPLNIEELAESISQILAKTHPNRLLFDPQALHDAAVATFGPDAFRQRLRDALTPLLESRPH
ncbi:MAG: glycosyltransferase [Verrucomicrobiaceae bacterium]|nr:glycosyltransferase [Verrucomicrobiaceae bacterium]